MRALTALTVMLWILAAATTFMVVVGSRRLYWAFDAKFVRRPEANEPSDAGYALRQGSMVVAALISVVGAIIMTAATTDQRYESASELYSVASSAGSELSGTSDSMAGPYPSEIEHAIYAAGDEDQLDVVRRGNDDTGDLYEIRTKDGRYAVCLTVRSDWDPFEPDVPTSVTTSVAERPC